MDNKHSESAELFLDWFSKWSGLEGRPKSIIKSDISRVLIKMCDSDETIDLFCNQKNRRKIDNIQKLINGNKIIIFDIPDNFFVGNIFKRYLYDELKYRISFENKQKLSRLLYFYIKDNYKLCSKK